MSRTLAKVDLDKYILIKEKLTSIWNEEGQREIRGGIRQQKNERRNLLIAQKRAYTNVLEFVKERNSIPVAEEKMLMDGLKLVLDNGWTLGEAELVQLMHMCGLISKVYMDEKYLPFLEFLFYLSYQFGFEAEKVT